MTTDEEAMRGSATLELVAITPVLLLLLLAVIAGARIAGGQQQIDAAAREATRAASLQATTTAATHAATEAADAYLAGQDLPCTGLTVAVTGGFTAPFGTGASATVVLSCVTDLSDLALPGLPGHRTLSASYTAALNTYSTRTAP